MAIEVQKLGELRRKIQESLRIQKDSAEAVPYIDASSAISDASARQNHAIFARRGCGKTLLLHYSGRSLEESVRAVYLNCEDFKHHSFPNVLIEILRSLFQELEKHLTGWFGRKKKSKDLIKKIILELETLRVAEDSLEESIRRKTITEGKSSAEGSVGVSGNEVSFKIGAGKEAKSGTEIERTYQTRTDKLRDLNKLLPHLKQQIGEFFEVSSSVKSVFLQIDDLYHLKRFDQPFVVDYVHRLCKDVPLYFKIATLRHASSLYVDRDGQPIGAQERHDYQPINIDYTFADFSKTRGQNLRILHEFGRTVNLSSSEIDGLFKGEGFDRLVMAGGGVPRDMLSLFLEVLNVVQEGDGRIGKDDVRTMSRSNFERRIEELKQDSEGGEQDSLMRGIYAFREFCLERGTNVFVVPERSLQQRDDFRDLVYRLLDYRIIHNAGAALTHKSQPGTYQAFAIDIGCYAHLRKLQGKFTEVDLADRGARERFRSAPVFGPTEFEALLKEVPDNIEDVLLRDDGT